MSNRLRAAAAVVLATGLASAGAQTGPGPSPRTLDLVGRPPLKERVAPTETSNPLARLAVYGLVAGRGARPVPFPARGAGHPQLWVEGLGAADRALCVELARAQGGYEASFVVPLPGGARSVRIPFDSSDAARGLFAAGTTAAELVARVRPTSGSACADGAPLLPSALDEPAAASTELHLAVGGAGKGVPAVRVNGQEKRACQTVGRLLGIRDFGANVYGYLCPVAVAGESCRADNVALVLWEEGNTTNDEATIRFRRRCDAPR